MRNRVQILRQQLQKEKDAIKKHKSMTDEMVKKKVEISKINSLVRVLLSRKTKIPLPYSHRYHI